MDGATERSRMAQQSNPLTISSFCYETVNGHGATCSASSNNIKKRCVEDGPGTCCEITVRICLNAEIKELVYPAIESRINKVSGMLCKVLATLYSYCS